MTDLYKNLKLVTVALLAVMMVASCGEKKSTAQEEKGKSVGKSSSKLTIDTEQVIAEIQPTMYGIFFEDINFAIDGGLYAELVKNRSFEFDKPLRGWTVLKDEGVGV